MSEFYAMMYLKRPKIDGVGNTDAVMYPFDSEADMMEFKKNVDILHHDGVEGFCEDCERVNIDDIRDESHD
jgi:hypothetical protein